MTIYNKTAGGAYEASQLEAEINADAAIVPSCLSISGLDATRDGFSLVIEMAADLSGAEETALDAVIAAHVPDMELIDVAQLPFSEIDKNKLAVHPSYKPSIAGITTYAVWCGAGDEVDGSGELVDDGEIGGGPLLHLDCEVDKSEAEVFAKFHPQNGRVWLHEAYIKFFGAPEKTYLSGGIIAMGTPLQQLGGLDLILVGNTIAPSPGGAGTGTHGFADPTKIVLVPRTFSHDGYWNYDPTNQVTPLTPAAGDGGYHMYSVDTLVHRFVNRIPTFDSSPYFSITSDETTELPTHYFVRVCAKTTDGTNFAQAWHASVVLEIYRESTYRNV